MEFYQTVAKRSAQTVAVVNQYVPTLKVAGVDAAGLQTQGTALAGLAQLRDDAVATADGAVNAEQLGFSQIHDLVVGLPKDAEGELSDQVPAESALLDLLSPAYAINPRTTDLAIKRGMIVKTALLKINTYLAAQTPPRGPVTTGGKGVTDLSALMDAQPALEQAVEDTAADVTSARSDLQTAATNVDRLNKRFYAKLQAEARTNPALAAALSQITTDSANLPATLGISSIVQGGTDQLHLLVSYDNASYDGTLTSSIEWMVAGTDPDFTNSATVDPSGNTLGPFAVGKVVSVRTRVTNSNGSTLGSVRTLQIQQP